MAEFSFRAARADGSVIDEHIEAASRDVALRQLRERALTPIRLDAITPATAPLTTSVVAQPGKGWFRGNPAIVFADIHDLTCQLSIMLRAGLPLDRALKILIDMSSKASMRDLLADLLKSVKSGKGLSQALATQQAHFGEFYINMVRAGEMGGQLVSALAQLGEHLERVRSLRESIVSALVYPMILVVVAVVSVLLLLGFVVPQFESLFEDMGDALPLMTRAIIAAGDFVAQCGWALLIVAVCAFVLLRRWFASEAGCAWRDRQLLHLPLLGSLVRKYEITRFCRSMGTLLGSGVPLVTALRIAADTMSNRLLRQSFSAIIPTIKQGGRVAEALQTSGLFTPLALNMVRLGEETGRLDDMLLEVARIHDGEVQNGVKRSLTLIEPLLILLLGGVIALIIISILMGILSINELAV